MKTLIIFISILLLSSCAKPKVVDIYKDDDKKLNCEQLKDAIDETQRIKKEAEYAKDATGGNVARAILFWPAWARTLHNADVAIIAADNRNYHLIKLMKKKNCKGIKEINNQIINRETFNDLSGQLRDLKEMYDSGDLTKEEFKKAKKKLLD